MPLTYLSVSSQIILETFAKDRIGFRATSAVRRDISISHCDSCGLDSRQYMRDKLRSLRSHATGDSQGPRPVLSRFAAARTAVACREFVGAVAAASYRRRL